jgi:putative transposase
LPDHLHCIWTLPAEDTDFSTRWKMIKRQVSRQCPGYHRPEWATRSRNRHREGTIWQRQFWKHGIRDEEDFSTHADYIHFNPAKHGLVSSVRPRVAVFDLSPARAAGDLSAGLGRHGR